MFRFLPVIISRCSTIGPSASAGKKVSAPTSTITPISKTTNSGVCVGSVPGPAGTSFFSASEPAIASVGIASQKRAKNIARPPVEL